MNLDDLYRELLEAARPYGEAEPQEDWVCNASVGIKGCGRCQRLLRLRAAIKALDDLATPTPPPAGPGGRSSER